MSLQKFNRRGAFVAAGGLSVLLGLSFRPADAAVVTVNTTAGTWDGVSSGSYGGVPFSVANSGNVTIITFFGDMNVAGDTINASGSRVVRFLVGDDVNASGTAFNFQATGTTGGPGGGSSTGAGGGGGAGSGAGGGGSGGGGGGGGAGGWSAAESGWGGGGGNSGSGGGSGNSGGSGSSGGGGGAGAISTGGTGGGGSGGSGSGSPGGGGGGGWGSQSPGGGGPGGGGGWHGADGGGGSGGGSGDTGGNANGGGGAGAGTAGTNPLGSGTAIAGGGAGGSGGGGAGGGQGGGGGAGAGGGGGGGGGGSTWGAWPNVVSGHGGGGGSGGTGGSGGGGGVGGSGGSGGQGGAGGGAFEILANGVVNMSSSAMLAQGSDGAAGSTGSGAAGGSSGGGGAGGNAGGGGASHGGHGGWGGGGGNGASGGAGGGGGGGGGGAGGAGGTVKIFGTVVSSASATVNVAGGAGGSAGGGGSSPGNGGASGSAAATGGNGRFLFGNNTTTGYSGSVTTGTQTSFDGTRDTNPFLSSLPQTPMIPNLVGGSDVYGRTTLTPADAAFAGVVAGMPYANSTYGAVFRMDVGPASGGYNHDFTGHDMVVYLNLKGTALSTPKFSVDGYAAQPLVERGFANMPAFGGSGAVLLAGNELAGNSVYATLVPSGSTTFTAEGTTPLANTLTDTQSLANGQWFYLNSFLLPTAEANGAYVLNAGNFAGIGLSSAGSSDPEGGPLGYAWQVNAFNSSAANPTLSLAASGLTFTTSTATINLTVTDETLLTAGDTAGLSYANAAPNAPSASSILNPDYSVTLTGTFTDADLVVNSAVNDFEKLTFEFDTTAAVVASDIGDGFLLGMTVPTETVQGTLMGTLTYPQLIALFGVHGTYTVYANVRDRVGTVIQSTPVQIRVVPEPGTIAIWSVLASLAWVSRRRWRRG